MPDFSEAGMSLLRQLEGLRLTAYDDATGHPPEPGDRVFGRLTIGYGHTGADVTSGLVWSLAEAERGLSRDVTSVAGQLRGLLECRLSDNQFSALVCLAYNIGTAAVAGSSALRFVNDGRLESVPAHLQLWTKVTLGGVLAVSPGLVGRRAAEVSLWLLPDGATAPDFSAIRDQAVRAFGRHLNAA